MRNVNAVGCIVLLCLLGGAGLSRGVTEYRTQVSRTEWSRARELTVQNPAAIEDTLAVIVAVEPRKGVTYAVADTSGRALIAQADDLDEDGVVDEVCFLLTVAAGAQRRVFLLDREGAALTAPSDMRIAKQRAGSWLPLRMQPTFSPSVTQHSTYISEENLSRARKIMDRLEKPLAMTLLECDDFRLLLGHESGLIEGMRPAGIPADYAGSFLREFVPGEPVMHAMKHVLSGPVRQRLVWTNESGAQRVVTVYRNGAIETAWTKEAPARLQILVCAYPYRYLQAGDSDTVRYSQVLEKRRALPNADRLSFFGRRDASLRIETTGLHATEHQVWLDAGEIGWNAGVDAHEKTSDERPVERVGRLCADTTVAGGLHLTSWQGAGGQATVTYRIANTGARSREAGTGLVRVNRASLSSAAMPALQAPEPEPPVAVTLKRAAVTVNRLHPNRFNGWELQPKTLAEHNPQPGYFAADLRNRSDAAAVIELELDAADWILQASLLSARRELTQEHSSRIVAHFDREEDLAPGGAPVRVEVPAGTSVPVELCIRPKEDTLGRLSCRLRWRGAGIDGAADLTVTVRPTILFCPVYAALSELGAEYSNLTRVGAPLLYDQMFWGGATPERDLWNQAHYRDYERKGFWLSEPIMLSNYITTGAGAFSGIDRLSWAKRVVDRLNDPRFSAYRAQIYLHDEIWEKIGGKEGRWRPLSEAISLDRMVTMNTRNAAWASFMEHGINEGFQYHIKLPNDIAEVFYYCGQDKRLHQYARKLVGPRTALFEQWKKDPGHMAGAGTNSPRQIISFWISTQLHVTRYEPVRRQSWWLRHHGIDMLRSWAWSSGGYDLYAGRIMHLTAMPAEVDGKKRYLLTDRGLAWMDMKEDMDLITLVRLLREDVTEASVLKQLDALAEEALEASQRNEFDQARHHYVAALTLLRPDLLYLAPADLYRGQVKADTLPDLRKEDRNFARARQIPTVAVPRLSATGRRPKPAVDGGLDNAYLEQGAVLEMREYNNGGEPDAATTVYLTRDGESLYVLFVCDEPKIADLRSRITERDGLVYEDDCVELFIDRAGDGKQYTHVVANAIGTLYDSRRDLGTAWNLPLAVKTLRGADSWTAEFRIPFQALGDAPKAGERWRMNFTRERKAVFENSAWSVTFGAFHNPDRFGIVEFE